GRRAQRERASARPERTPPTFDVVAKLELQQRVLQEVRNLDEPYRSAIVYRYYDRRKPREIARELGIPVKTVETRLRRAVEQLRARMDDAYGGDRRSWCLGLVTLVPLSRAAEAAVTSAAVTTGTVVPAAAIASAAAQSAAAFTGAIMTAKTAAILTATLVLAAFGAGWALKPLDSNDASTRRAPTSETNRVARARYDAALSENEALKARADDLQRKLEALQAGAEEAPAAGEAAEQDAEVEARDPKAPAFRFAGMEQALDEIDWEAMGESVRNLAPLLEKMMAAIEETGEIDFKDIGAIQQWNGPLLTAALKLNEHPLAGSGVNGKFTNPGVASNMVHAALAKSDQPLSADQRSALREATVAFLQADGERLHSYSDDAVGLEKFMDEMALKERYYARLHELLTPEQQSILHPEAVRGHTGVDLFSTGITWGTLTAPVQAKDRAGLREEFVMRHMRSLKLDESARPVLQRLAADWAATLPEDLPAAPTSAIVRQMRYMETAHAAASAKRYLEVRKAMLAQLPLSDVQRKKLLVDAHFPVPFLSAPK
ncbi:MAG: RNA polymerase sigma factor, partial [Planctomycetota bacterium]